MVLLKDAEHLILMQHLAQLVRMLARWQTQQQTIKIFLKSKQVKLLGVREQSTIVIIYVTIYLIISCVQSACRLQQFYLRTVMQNVEHPDSLFGSGFVTMNGQSSIDDFLHTATDGTHIIQCDGTTD